MGQGSFFLFFGKLYDWLKCITDGMGDGNLEKTVTSL